mgnify:CR=1 FL=1
MKPKDIVKLILSIALAGLLVWLAFRSVDWRAFLEGLKFTRWIYIVPFFAASVGALACRAFRWQLLLRSTGLRPSWIAVWDANNVGNLANIAIPSSGEFLRGGYVAGKDGYGKVLGTILMERVWDFLAILVMTIIALVLDQGKFGPFFAENVWAPMAGNSSFPLWWAVALVVLFIAAFFWAVFRFRARSRFFGKIADALSSIGRGFSSFRQMEHKGLFLLYTFSIWLMYLLMCLSILWALPELSGLGIVDALFFTCVGNLASVIPVPGSIGAYHYLMALSVSSIYGHTWETGILFATLQHELHTILILILGVLSYIRLSLHARKSRRA